MDDLLAGVNRFSQQVHGTKRALFDKLATGQSPRVLFITCADSRIDPSLITQSEPGDIFVCRNAGNIVPAADSGLPAEGTVASVEYAVSALGVSHIVLCGHADCGAVKAAMNPASAASLANVAAWIAHADTGGHSHLDTAIEANVTAQLANLMTYDFVADAVAAGSLALHGWVYDIGSGYIRQHDGDSFSIISAPAGSAQ